MPTISEFFARRHSDQERCAFEVVIPAQRRRHGRGWVPERVIPLGHMATCPQNNAVGGLPAILEDVPSGHYKASVRRPRRPDGMRGRLVAPDALQEGQRWAVGADLEAEDQARALIERALQLGELVHRGRRVKVFSTPSGAVRTIPDKGQTHRWATVEDLIQALATGAI